jgi:hypothetical protein
MKLSDIKKEADLVITDLGETGKSPKELTQRFYIQEVAKVHSDILRAKNWWYRLLAKIRIFFTREKELVSHFLHAELNIVKEEYFDTKEKAEAYKAKIVTTYAGIEKSFK